MGNSQSCCLDRGGSTRECCGGYEACLSEVQKNSETAMRVQPTGFKMYDGVMKNSSKQSFPGAENVSPMKIRNNRMDDERIQKNMIKLISKKDPVFIGIHHTSPRKSGQSSWIEIPKPLPDWTQEEQGSLIEIIEQHPKAANCVHYTILCNTH